MSIQITLTLTSLAQLEGLDAALDLFLSSEAERRQATRRTNEWTPADERHFVGALQLRKILDGAK